MIHLSIRRFCPCGRYMVAFKIGGFLNAKQTMPCKHCDNLKMETAVEIIGEKERSQFCAHHSWYQGLLGDVVQFTGVTVSDLVEQWCSCSRRQGLFPPRNGIPQPISSSPKSELLNSTIMQVTSMGGGHAVLLGFTFVQIKADKANFLTLVMSVSEEGTWLLCTRGN